jgi:quercetin dioxygenase-like cupin family protein
VELMEIVDKQPTTKGGPDMFVGDAWIDVIVRGEEPSRIRVSIVRFAPGARNAWHAHAMGQTFYVTEGVGRTQSRGPIVEIRAGDTVSTPSAEWHWHGAAPNHFMTHLAIWEAPVDGPESEFGDQVTDDEYLGAPTEASR